MSVHFFVCFLNHMQSINVLLFPKWSQLQTTCLFAAVLGRHCLRNGLRICFIVELLPQSSGKRHSVTFQVFPKIHPRLLLIHERHKLLLQKVKKTMTKFTSLLLLLHHVLFIVAFRET